MQAGICSWRHVGGAPTANGPAFGSPTISNYVFSRFIFPGARFGHAALAITQGPHAGTTFMVGGFGLPVSGPINSYCSELWAFRSDSGWALVGGQLVGNAAPVFGTQGMPSPTTRIGSVSAGPSLYQTTMFGNGNPFIYIYGGQTSSVLWRFHTGTREFTWMGGVGSVVGGTLGSAFGTFSALNWPGSRAGSFSLTTAGGRHLLVGGIGPIIGAVAPAMTGGICTVWEFQESTNQWAVIEGPVGGVGEVDCAANASASAFGGRSLGLAASIGNRAFFGMGLLQSTSAGMSDLWEFDLTSNRFVFLAGSGNSVGFYGARGVQSASFSTPARYEFGSTNSIGRLAADGSGDAEFFIPCGKGPNAATLVLETKQTMFLVRYVIPPTTTTTAPTMTSTLNPNWCASSFGGVQSGSVCNVATLAEARPCVKVLAVSNISPPDATSPLIRFTSGTVNLACDLEIQFNFPPIGGQCVIAVKNPAAIVQGSFSSVTVRFAQSTCIITQTPSSDSTGTISVDLGSSPCGGGGAKNIFIGAAIGGIVFLVLLILLIVYCVKKNKSAVRSFRVRFGRRLFLSAL